MSEQYIGKYRIEDRLGSGTFATVYRCYDPDLDSICAIKVLAENWSEDENARSWFLNEARVMFGIEHPAILRIFTSGSLEDGRPYFVMEYADQGSLADLIVTRRSLKQRFSTAEALEISIEIADGLYIAHNQGLVHRDLKPSNILFRHSQVVDGRRAGERQIKLADFGLARRLEQGASSLAGAGTPHYIAPEQARGLADDKPDVRSDIYSAATILYELLAGQVPFPYRSTKEAIAAHLNEQPPQIQTLAPDVPDEIAQLVHNGLAKDPDQRVPDALAWKQHVQVLRTALSPDGSILGWGDFEHFAALGKEADHGESREEILDSVPLPGVIPSVSANSANAEDESYPEQVYEHRRARRSSPLLPYTLAAVAIGVLIVAVFGFALAGLIEGEDGTVTDDIQTIAETGMPDEDDLEGLPTATPEVVEEQDPTPAPDPTPTEEPEATATPESEAQPEFELALGEVTNTLQALPGHASSSVILPSGDTVNDEGGREVAAASTIKLWVAATTFEEISLGNLDLDTEHTIQAEEQAFGTGILNQEQFIGRTLTIQELIETMLLHSDNTAANVLIERIGGLERVNEYASHHGYGDTRMQRMLGDLDPERENYTSAADGAQFMERLINDEVVDRSTSEQLRSILERRSSNDAVELDFFGRYLPDGLGYSHISGLLPGVRNEIGYFYHDELGGYVLVSFMLADLPDEAGAEDAIAQAIAEIHEHLSRGPEV